MIDWGGYSDFTEGLVQFAISTEEIVVDHTYHEKEYDAIFSRMHGGDDWITLLLF